MTIPERIHDAETAGGATGRAVSSHNEWDPLEEVVLGRLDGAAAQTPAIPAEETRRDLEGLAEILGSRGVTVHRPEPTPHARTFETVDWKERGFSSACPRDAVLVVGDQLVETPLAWRSRYYETDALRSLFLAYFRNGARWTSAPRPELKDELYEEARGEWLDDRVPSAVTTELEPILAAADVARCGRDLFALRTAGTNRTGIEWLRRHLGPEYRVHEIHPRRQISGHLDTVFLPLSAHRILVREDAIDPLCLPEVLRDREILVAPPEGDGGAGASLNVLLLDPDRVLVERTQTRLIEALRGWAFEPIPVSLAGYAALGGSVRRATLDIRRRGDLVSYY